MDSNYEHQSARPPAGVSEDLSSWPMDHRSRLQRFYTLYAPEKLGNIDTALRTFYQKEDKMWSVLVQRYGPEPGEPVDGQRAAAATAAAAVSREEAPLPPRLPPVVDVPVGSESRSHGGRGVRFAPAAAAAAAAALSSEQQQQVPSGAGVPSSSTISVSQQHPLLCIPLIRRVLLFENNKKNPVSRLVELASVTDVWFETIQCYPVFNDISSARVRDTLARAAGIGSLWLVKSIVSPSFDLTRATSARFGSPFLLAVQGNHFDVVRFLLDSQQDIDEVDINERTCLHLARTGEMLTFLLDHLATLENSQSRNDMLKKRILALDYAGLPPLYAAAERGDLDVCRILIREMVKLNIDPCPLPAHDKAMSHSDAARMRDDFDTSPLFAACSSGNEEIVALLLFASEHKFVSHRSCLQALSSGHTHALDKIIQLAGGPTADSHGEHWLPRLMRDYERRNGVLDENDPVLQYAVQKAMEMKVELSSRYLKLYRPAAERKGGNE